MNNLNTFNSLSKNEVGLIARLSFERKKIVSSDELKRYIPESCKDKNKFIFNLMQKNILEPIKKGFYTFNSLEFLPEGRKVSNYLIPNIYFPNKDYYIGYSSAFNYYGFTEQVFQTMYVINTNISSEKEINNSLFKFIKVKNEYMYGIQEVEINGGTIMISDKERTMIDLIYWCDAVGGIISAIKKLEDIIVNKECDIEKFIDYAVKYPRPTIRKCIGIVLDNCGIDKKLVDRLYDTIKDTSITSASWNSRKGTKNKKWRVIINEAA